MAAGEISYIDNLRLEGYAAVPLDISGADIDPLFEQFREFSVIAWPEREAGENDAAFARRCAAGQNLVEATHYRVSSREKDADYYMIHRRVGEDTPFSRTAATENKDVLHTGPRTLEYATERLGTKMPYAMRLLLESCNEVHEAVKRSVRPVFRELGIEATMLAENGLDDIHMVRVLRYLGTNATHKADLHFDRAATTMAVWESSPGLVGTPGNNGLASALSPADLERLVAQANASPINHVSGEGKFFLGAGYNRLAADVHERNGTLPLLAHGVINEESDQERDAVVVFMNPHVGVRDYVVPSKAETSLAHLRDSLAA